MRSQDSADYKIGNETYSSPPTATQNSPTQITDTLGNLLPPPASPVMDKAEKVAA